LRGEPQEFTRLANELQSIPQARLTGGLFICQKWAKSVLTKNKFLFKILAENLQKGIVMWDPYAEFEKTVLPNGLTVYATEWPEREWEAMGFIVHSGSKDDPDDLEGLSHFLEHMMFGHSGMSETGIQGFFKDAGGWVKLGTTGIFGSHYSFFAPTEKEILTRALHIFGSALFKNPLSRGLEIERAAVISEFNQEFKSKLVLELASSKRKALYSSIPALSKRAIGTPDSFERMTADHLREFYSAHYVPQNMTVVAIGGIKPQEILGFLGESPFGAERNGKRNPPLVPQASSPHPSRTKVVIEAKNYSSVELNCWAMDAVLIVPGVLSDALFIFHPMFHRTLYDLLRTEKNWVYDVGLNRTKMVEHVEFGFGISFPLGVNVEDAESVVEEGIQKAFANPALFEDWKRRRIASAKLTDISGEDLLKSCTRQLLEEQKITSNKQDVADIEAITFDHIRELSKWFSPEHRYSVITIP
jgi:predicted Zn-dependent peptidase